MKGGKAGRRGQSLLRRLTRDEAETYSVKGVNIEFGRRLQAARLLGQRSGVTIPGRSGPHTIRRVTPAHRDPSRARRTERGTPSRHVQDIRAPVTVKAPLHPRAP